MKIFKNEAIQSSSEILYLCNYYPSGTHHHGSDSWTRMVLRIKDGAGDAIRFCARLLDLLLTDAPFAVCAVPGHSKSKRGSGVHTICHLLTQTGQRIDGADCVVRHRTIEKLSGGGNRDQSVHLQSVRIEQRYLIEGRPVLLLDDVTTSGGSLLACARLLVEAGASMVLCLSIGKTYRYGTLTSGHQQLLLKDAASACQQLNTPVSHGAPSSSSFHAMPSSSSAHGMPASSSGHGMPASSSGFAAASSVSGGKTCGLRAELIDPTGGNPYVTSSRFPYYICPALHETAAPTFPHPSPAFVYCPESLTPPAALMAPAPPSAMPSSSVAIPLSPHQHGTPCGLEAHRVINLVDDSGDVFVCKNQHQTPAMGRSETRIPCPQLFLAPAPVTAMPAPSALIASAPVEVVRAPPLADVRAVLFDLDYTLIDSKVGEAIRRSNAGDKWTRIREASKTFPTYPGIEELLGRLQGRFLIGVVTSSVKVVAQQIVNDRKWPIDAMICWHDTQRHKPFPDPVVELLRAMGIAAGEAVMIGDSTSDIYAGQDAGTRTVAALWDPRSRPALEESGADHFCDTPADLAKLFFG